MSHTCHWTGCPIEVDSALWGCASHWRALPIRIRLDIKRTYRPGQEIDKQPSAEYLAAARAARNWIASAKEPAVQ